MKTRNKTILFLGLIFALLIGNAIWYFHVPQNRDYVTLAPSKFLNLKDTQVHYVEEIDDGSQPTLLLIHGFASSSYTWYKVWPLLAPHFHLIAIDLPGFGLSEKKTNIPYTLDTQSERLIEFIQKTQIQPVNVMAWSMGGLISLYSAKREPQLFHKILAITPALDPDIVYFPAALAEWLAPALAPWLITPQYIKFTFLFAFRKKMTSEENDHFSYQAYYPYHKSPEAFLNLIAHLKVIKDGRIPQALKNIKTPYEILAANHDRIVKLKHYNKFIKAVPEAKITYHPESGHGIMVDDPMWVQEQALRFFKPALTKLKK